MNATPPRRLPTRRTALVTRAVAAVALLAIAGLQLANGQWLLAVSSTLFAVMAGVGAWAAARGALPMALLASLFVAGVAAWAGACFLPAP